MPIYEYACTSCGERTEARQSFTDPPLEECERCGGKLRKLYSPVGIVFKGSGFYSTDTKKGAGSTKSSDSKSDSKSDAKSDPSSSSGATKTKDSSGGGSEKSA